MSSKFNTRKRYVNNRKFRTEGAKRNSNNEIRIIQEENNVADREISELDRLENVLAHHQETVSNVNTNNGNVDENNNEIRSSEEVYLDEPGVNHQNLEAHGEAYNNDESLVFVDANPNFEIEPEHEDLLQELNEITQQGRSSEAPSVNNKNKRKFHEMDRDHEEDKENEEDGSVYKVFKKPSRSSSQQSIFSSTKQSPASIPRSCTFDELKNLNRFN